jgi:hypothetical protein
MGENPVEARELSLDSVNSQAIKTLSRPRVLTLNLVRSVVERLATRGLRVSSGSLGQPYRFPPLSGEYPVIFPEDIPQGIAEQDVIIVDLDFYGREVTHVELQQHQSRAYSNFPDPSQKWVANTTLGRVDPRPAMMEFFRPSFETMLYSGGIFIIFASRKEVQDYRREIQASRNPGYNALSLSNWEFLSSISRLDIQPESGQHISIVGTDPALDKFLTEGLNEAEYRCTIDLPPELSKKWLALALRC